MNIAITGATGLLGSSLSNYFVSLGWDVYVLVKDEHSKELLSKNVHRVYGNIDNRIDVEYFVQKSLPDYFIHLAAQTQAYDSLKYPYNTFYTNMVGTLNVLEALKEYDKCKSIIVASSDKAYGELVGTEYTEDHRLNGIYPYDASKSATDIISNSYRLTYNMPVVTTRACNMYGPGDYNKQRLIPGIVQAYLEDSTFTIRNNGEDIREYIHVDDVVSAYVKILFTANNAPSYNISSGERYSTMDVFNMVQESISKEIKHNVIKTKSLEIRKQFMNSSLLTEKTGWTPKILMKEIMPNIINWYINERK